jgi:hypothetical protein
MSGAARRTRARVMRNEASLGFMVTSFLKIYLVFVKKGQFLKGRKERPQRDINSPWSLHIGIFRKIHFIV